MAIIHPFKAWRPTTEAVEEVACVPYDVIDTDEARELADGKPNSFLHVIRPEIDLPDGTPYRVGFKQAYLHASQLRITTMK